MKEKTIEIKVWVDPITTLTRYEISDPLTQTYSRVSSLQALGEEVKHWAKECRKQLLREIQRRE